MSPASRSVVAAPFLRFDGLAGLVAPIEVGSFLDQFWEKRALLVAERCPVRDAIALDAWEDLAQLALKEDKKKVELLAPGRQESDATFDVIREGFASGESIRIVDAQSVFEPLKSLCANLTSELSHPVRANVYITPAHRQGLDPHVDDHDVFVVQMSGRKRWRLYGEPYPLPLQLRPRFLFEGHMNATWSGTDWGAKKYKLAADEPAALDTTLETGQMIYLPRGVCHVASSREATSIHATIGVHATRIADLAALVVDRMARDNPALRRSLPLGFARYLNHHENPAPEVDGALRGVTPRNILDALEELAARQIANRKDAQGAEVASSEPGAGPIADTIDERATLRLAHDILVTCTNEGVSLRSFRKNAPEAQFPRGFEPAIAEIVHLREFRVGDLKALSRKSANNLVRHLIAKGFVLPSAP